MSTFSRSIGLLAGASTLVAGGLLGAPNAQAVEAVSGERGDAPLTALEVSAVSPSQIDDAILEAQVGGAILRDVTASDGTRSVTIDLGSGYDFDLVQKPASQRLGAGSDGYGTFVSFNATDQHLIIGGAGAGLTAGICLLGPAVCAVATTAIVIATVAMTQNGGIRCGVKTLRVYPFSGHKPRCV